MAVSPTVPRPKTTMELVGAGLRTLRTVPAPVEGPTISLVEFFS